MPRLDLGLGVTWTPTLRPVVEEGTVDLLEVEPETMWLELVDGGSQHVLQTDAFEELAHLPLTKLVHGVAYPLGGGPLPSQEIVDLFSESAALLHAQLASSHLSFNAVQEGDGNFATGFLLPPRQTPAGVIAAAAAIRTVMADIASPFCVETGVNYLQSRPEELADGDYFAAVASEAECGLLLDLHNLWANERNGRQPVREVVDRLPLERVWEVHLAGGREHRGFWLDAHSGLVPERLMELAATILPSLPEIRALVFEIMAPYVPSVGLDAVRRQLDELRVLIAEAPPSPLPPRATSVLVGGAGSAKDDVDDVAEWECTLGRLAIGRGPSGRLGRELDVDPGTSVLRDLVAAGRRGVLVDTMTLTCRLLLLVLAEQGLEELLGRFWRSTPPALFPSSEALAFAEFLSAEQPNVPWLPDIVAFERAAIQLILTNEPQTVTFGCDPGSLLDALSSGVLPANLPAACVEMSLIPEP